LGDQFATLGTIVSALLINILTSKFLAFISNLGAKQQAKKMLKVGPKFFLVLTPSVKVGLIVMMRRNSHHFTSNNLFFMHFLITLTQIINLINNS
jgi:hypothetical protein